MQLFIIIMGWVALAAVSFGALWVLYSGVRDWGEAHRLSKRLEEDLIRMRSELLSLQTKAATIARDLEFAEKAHERLNAHVVGLTQHVKTLKK